MGYHGKPDWGMQVKSTVYTLDELSELAVRLGSPVFFDRRGDVLFMDNFSGGLNKWYTSGSGDDNKQLVTPESARTGGYSIKLVGGSTTPWYSYMRSSFPYSEVSKWGLELHFCFPSMIDKLVFKLIQDNAVFAYEGTICWDRTNFKLQYMDSEGDYKDIDAASYLLARENLFNVFKLVCDFETQKYHRLLVNDKTYDLSDYAVYKGGSQGVKFCEVELWLYSRNLHNDYAYIDNVIVTQNEP